MSNKRHSPPEFGHGGSPSRGAILAQRRASGAPGPMGSRNTRRLRTRGANKRVHAARSARGE